VTTTYSFVSTMGAKCVTMNSKWKRVSKEEFYAFIDADSLETCVVYKRRVDMTYLQAILYLCKHQPPPEETQVTREIDYFVSFYKKLRPAVSLFYDRMAYYSADDPDLRLTFDTNIRFRTTDLDISKGDYGYLLMGPEKAVLEIKAAGAMPLWLTHELDRLRIYPHPYSKYGNAYKLLLSAKSKDDLKIYQTTR